MVMEVNQCHNNTLCYRIGKAKYAWRIRIMVQSVITEKITDWRAIDVFRGILETHIKHNLC